MLSIAFPIALELRNPIVAIRFWTPRSVRAMVLVPETSVHEDHLPPRRKRPVGLAWKALVMKPIAKAHAMRQTPHDHFWPGVLPLDHLAVHLHPPDLGRAGVDWQRLAKRRIGLAVSADRRCGDRSKSRSNSAQDALPDLQLAVSRQITRCSSPTVCR